MGEPNWRNRTLFHGDNLGFLRGMNSESVHLIATDPPFNKNRDFHATPDSLASGASFQDRWSWERDVHQDWVDQLKDDFPKLMEAIESARYAHSDGMGAYMCFMAVRLLEMRRVLREDGSIYLHCDPTASHYLKAVMDAIFGWKNFRNEVVWHYQSGGRQKRLFSKKHDNILFYTKSNTWFFNPDAVGVLRGSQRRNNMKRGEDPDGRGYWSLKDPLIFSQRGRDCNLLKSWAKCNHHWKMEDMAMRMRKGFRREDVMGFITGLYDGDLHAKRVLSLANGTVGVLTSASLAVHAVGRGLAQAMGKLGKHGVKQVDRLLSNKGIEVGKFFDRWVGNYLLDSPAVLWHTSPHSEGREP